MIPLPDTIKNKLNYGLYIVSTPIGNLSDITIRALNVLKNSDYILCEDTRTSKKLLEKYEIKSKLISNHRFNETKYPSTNIQMDIFEQHINIIKSSGHDFLDPKYFPKIFFEEKLEKKIYIK